ncbi:hypothetical protein J8J22_22125, partial [Mycobacterium tuberculosis]|nr:hypothetical protein [Mycobacterium tuberculosis]
GTSSLDAASLMLQRGVPVVVATAYDQQRSGIAGFADVPVVLKPYGKTQILQAVTTAFARMALRALPAKEDGASGELV